jgi:hypothetical protein
MLRLCFVLLSCLAIAAVSTQRDGPYAVPRTPDGHPDFQGVWITEFLTMLERPPGVERLFASPEEARALVPALRARLPEVIDPDVHTHNIQQLARVKGEYRTSLIVRPANGQMPFTETGLDLVAWAQARNTQMFDGPEVRPLTERCMESLGDPPIRAIPVLLPRRFFQTRDHVAILTEDQVGLRVIRLGGEPPPRALRSVAGYSVGHWEGETLVVHTAGLRGEDPARFGIGRPLLLSRDSRITERFTRVSENELFYQFTVEDERLYTEPWTGEFSMTRYDGRTYEYACHEGNYSMPTILVGGRQGASGLSDLKADR